MLKKASMDSGDFGTWWWWGVGKFKQKERLFFITWDILPRVFERLRAFLSISLSYLLWVGAILLTRFSFVWMGAFGFSHEYIVH